MHCVFTCVSIFVDKAALGRQNQGLHELRRCFAPVAKVNVRELSLRLQYPGQRGIDANMQQRFLGRRDKAQPQALHPC